MAIYDVNGKHKKVPESEIGSLSYMDEYFSVGDGEDVPIPKLYGKKGRRTEKESYYEDVEDYRQDCPPTAEQEHRVEMLLDRICQRRRKKKSVKQNVVKKEKIPQTFVANEGIITLCDLDYLWKENCTVLNDMRTAMKGPLECTDGFIPPRISWDKWTCPTKPSNVSPWFLLGEEQDAFCTKRGSIRSVDVLLRPWFITSFGKKVDPFEWGKTLSEQASTKFYFGTSIYQNKYMIRIHFVAPDTFLFGVFTNPGSYWVQYFYVHARHT